MTRIRLRIEALSLEADWPRAIREDFAQSLQAALEAELRRAGASALAPARRLRIAAPGLSLAAPRPAAEGLAGALLNPPARGRP